MACQSIFYIIHSKRQLIHCLGGWLSNIVNMALLGRLRFNMQLTTPEIYAHAHYCLPNDTSPHFMPCTGDDRNAMRVMAKQQEFLRFLGHVWQHLIDSPHCFYDQSYWCAMWWRLPMVHYCSFPELLEGLFIVNATMFFNNGYTWEIIA